MLHARNIPEGFKRWIPPLVAAVAAVVVFLPVLGFEFLEYDDLIYVFQGPLSGGFSPASISDVFLAPYFRSYAPLTLLTHAIDLRLWGENAGMHHLQNLLLHAANVILVYLAAMRVFECRPRRWFPGTPVLPAISTALLFAVHPLQVEPVAWISGRKDVLMTFFLLLSFLMYLHWSSGNGRGEGEVDGRIERRGAGWLVASTASFLLALLSKSTAAAFPLVLIACDRLLLGRREPLPVLMREKAIMLLASCAAIVAAVLAGRGHDTSDLLAGFPPAGRVPLPLFTPVYYLWQLVWPSGLTPFTPPAPLPLAFLGAGVTVVVTSVLIRRRLSGLLAAWSAFLLLLAPTIGGTFMETGMQPWADRFTYAPMIPVFLVLGLGISRIPPVWARAALLAALTIGLAVLARAQLDHWRNTEAVWTRVVEASPQLAKGYKNLGSIRFSQGRTEEAVELLRRAIALKPAYSEAYNDLGLALAAGGRSDEALEAHRVAIALDSTRVEGYNGYGIAMLNMGNARGAYDAFRRGLAVHPGSARLRYNAAVAALALGDTAASIAHFQETVYLDSTAIRAAENAAILLEATGDPAAAAWYERAANAGSAVAKAWPVTRDTARGPGER